MVSRLSAFTRSEPKPLDPETDIDGSLLGEVLGFMKEILFTIVPQSNVTITGDRVGLTRSAMRLGGA